MAVSDLPDAAAWQAAVARMLKGADPATLVSVGRDGIPIEPLYAPAEAVAQPWRAGATPVAVVQPVDQPDPDEAAQLALLDVEGGASGLTLVFAGTGAARGFGLPMANIDAVLEAVADRVPLRCELPPNVTSTALARLGAACERHGASLDVAADPLGAHARLGQAELASAADRWIETAVPFAPAGALFCIDGRPHHEAGASEAQELAAVLSAGVDALRALERAGRDCERIAFTLTADTDQLFTIAKLRALRRLWARVEVLCGLTPHRIALHAETGWRTLTRADPWTNLLRGTVACAGAILGGADSVTVLPFTAALGLPGAAARRLARNTPLILLQEAGLGRVADPLAGSGAIEALTAALCREAWALFQDVEREGGLAATLLAGTWWARLAATRNARAADLRSGRSKLVGVTAFRPPPDAVLPSVLRPAPAQAVAADWTRFPPLPSSRDAEPFEIEEYRSGL